MARLFFDPNFQLAHNFLAGPKKELLNLEKFWVITTELAEAKFRKDQDSLHKPGEGLIRDLAFHPRLHTACANPEGEKSWNDLGCLTLDGDLGHCGYEVCFLLPSADPTACSLHFPSGLGYSYPCSGHFQAALM